ncbi:MAG: UDP-2,4-diacetamido-2,4,6-trideoxy-beta-L-altropyranose hydrolase [Betaproteobacteria bacterium]|jgi:UDP-2,4-diacetamido-2,4,6-trideoxy-beta-L-altropyranose hydrolase
MSPAKRIAIRADASSTIGAGHIMRCLTLANELRHAGAEILFLSRNVTGDAFDIIHNNCFPSISLGNATSWSCDADRTLAALINQPPFDWLIVDHYGLDRGWESRTRSVAHKILVIDDLANRPHDCDALLDQNYYINAKQRYDSLVPSNCRLFLGLEFALLRNEFKIAARNVRPRQNHIRRILVTFGATDPTNETEKVLSALRSLDSPLISVDVVVGTANLRRSVIEALCSAMPRVRCHVQTNRMVELMNAADLAIGAAGATTWERCILGLPALTVITADNQKQTASDLAAAGAIWLLGQANDLTANHYETALRTAIDSPARLRSLSIRARDIMAMSTALPEDKRHPVVEMMLEKTHHA